MTAAELILALASFDSDTPVILIVGMSEAESFTVEMDDFGDGPTVVLEGDAD